MACEEMLGAIGGLQKKIEDEQYRGMGGPGGRGQQGGSGDIDLNYHNPAPTPAYVAALVGIGSAPIHVYNPTQCLVGLLKTEEKVGPDQKITIHY